MSYDELEEQYYIFSQKNKELESKNNHLELLNIDLLSKQIKAEKALCSIEKKLDIALAAAKTSAMEVIQVKIVNTGLTKELNSEKDLVATLHKDLDYERGKLIREPEQVFARVWTKPSSKQAEFRQFDYQPERFSPGYGDKQTFNEDETWRLSEPSRYSDMSVHSKMKKIQNITGTRITLDIADTLGVYEHIEASGGSVGGIHAYGLLGDRVVRFAGPSLLELDRVEDFEVVTEQMLDGLREVIYDKYALF